MTNRARILATIAAAAALAGFVGGMVAESHRAFPTPQLHALADWARGAPQQQPQWTSAEARKVARELRAMPRHGDVLMIGDSVTRGVRWAELFPDQDIIERGIGGDTVTGVLLRARDYLDPPPRYIFVMAGINDALNGLPAAGILARYDRLVARLSASGARVFVQSVLDCGSLCDSPDAPRGARATQRAINAGLPAIAARHGATWIDLNPAMSRDGRLRAAFTFDGVHLNDAGALAWRGQIARYMPPPCRQTAIVRRRCLDPAAPAD